MGELHNTYIDSACNYIVHALNTLGELMDRRHTILNRMLIIMASIFALVALMGAASATDYYVATWGDNTAQGNITHPWQNVSYATQQAVAGDTIYLFDGTWYDEHAIFANSGNATHPITLTAYNGTPTMDGVDKTGCGIYIDFNDHIEISNLIIRRYYNILATPGSYIHTSDCDLSDTDEIVIVLSRSSSTHNTIENCTLHDSGWNTIQVSGNREPPNGNGIPATHITVRNCTVYNSNSHNPIDLFGNVEDVLIEDCYIYNSIYWGIYSHDNPDYKKNITIRNNIFSNLGASGVSLYDVHDGIWVTNATVSNNTFRDIYGHNAIELSNCDGITVYNNSFDNITNQAIRTYSGALNVTLDRNNISADSKQYMISYGSNVTIRNPLGKRSISVIYDNSTATLEYDDNTLFIASPSGEYHDWVPVRYYPNVTNCSASASGWGGSISSIVVYNISLSPASPYLKDVVVNHESNATDDRTNITINSSISTNPTWINTTMQNATHNYSVAVDGSIVDYIIADSEGVVSYPYTSSWSIRDFEFDWVDIGVFSPDHTKAYYNLASPIENTVNSTGYVQYNITLGWGDTICASSRLTVIT